MLPEPVNFPETKTIATLGEPFVIMAECICGHTRELHTLFYGGSSGQVSPQGKVRNKLRCHKCQARMPTVRIYRRAPEV